MRNLPHFFKGAVMFRQKRPLKIINLETPDLEKNQVLVKVISAGICGAQLGEINGVKGPDKWVPHCMGHEGFGIIVKKNINVKDFDVGNFVILHWRKSNLESSFAPTYKSSFGRINAGYVTTFQEYSVISINRITKINFKKKLEKIYPLLGCVLSTAFGIISKEIVPKKKDKILIIGGGGVGVSIAVMAKILGLNNILIIEKSTLKRKYLSKFNIKTIYFKNSNFLKKYINKNIRFDKILDTTGDNGLISLGFQLLNKNGELVIVGQPKQGSVLKIYDPIRFCKLNKSYDGVRIIASDGGLFNPSTDMQKLIKLVSKNFKLVEKIITHEVNLKDVNKGLSLVEEGRAIRVLVKIS